MSDPVRDSPPIPLQRDAHGADLVVRDACGAELVAGCALLARALDFSDRDALPPWLVQTAAGCGSLALGAFAGDRLVGFSFALRAADDELFSCGLAVDAGQRDRGIGRRLKLAQRERALLLGCTRIRWTAEPLSAPALALYLSGLGARLTAYAPRLYAALRPGPVEPDDVLIEWPLVEAPPNGAPAARVEIPYDVATLDRHSLRKWRFAVRAEMTALLAAGAVGTRVFADHDARRAWVAFSVPA